MTRDISERTARELADMICGEKIGEGMSRSVYRHLTDDDLVVKVEERGGFFQNVMEWETWQAVKDTPHAKWLAPCVSIGSSGIVLMMRRTKPLRDWEAPKRMPRWLADFKLGNYGVLDFGETSQQVVCHDYGTSMILHHGAFSRATKSVLWAP